MTKITVSGSELSKAILWALKGVPGKTAENTTSNKVTNVLKLSLEDHVLTLLGSDGVDSYSATVDVQRDLGDTSTIERLILDTEITPLARTENRNELVLDFTASDIKVSSSQNRAKTILRLVDNAIEPKAHKTPAKLGKILGSDLKKALNSVVIAASSDITMESLTSVLFEFKPAEKKLLMVSTDRYQLSSRTISLSVNGSRAQDEPFRVLLSAKSLKNVVGSIDPDAQISIGASSKSKGLSLTSNSREVILGEKSIKYVNFERLLSTQLPNTIFGSVDELKEAVNYVDAYSAEKVDGAISLTVKQDGSFLIHNRKAEREMDIEGYAGDDFTVIVDPKLLKNALSAVFTDKFAFKFESPQRAVIMTDYTEGEGVNPFFTYLVMPRTK